MHAWLNTRWHRQSSQMAVSAKLSALLPRDAASVMECNRYSAILPALFKQTVQGGSSLRVPPDYVGCS
jgi:hypothetical protein